MGIVYCDMKSRSKIPDGIRQHICLEHAKTGGDIKQVSKAVGVSEGAVYAIINKIREEDPLSLVEMEKEVISARTSYFVGKAWDKLKILLDGITPEKVANSSVKDIGIAVGIIFDKLKEGLGEESAEYKEEYEQYSDQRLLELARKRGVNFQFKKTGLGGASRQDIPSLEDKPS